ncbi:hypothetical protein NMY22_g19316 [Coprinellus aureogranulatus]|nr:hypothetical protein NMY22_g19316 [Coprinellus aureogranulatus]
MYLFLFSPLIIGQLRLGLLPKTLLQIFVFSSHSEVISFAVVSVPYPLILGLDWLCRHNPHINWTDPHLTLSCCDLPSPISVRPRGSGLVGPSQSHDSIHACPITSTGLGFGLQACLLSRVPAPTCTAPVDPEPPPVSSPKSSFLSFLTQWTGFGRSTLDSSLPRPPLNISTCTSRRFRKYAKNAPLGVIRYHAVGSPSYVSATLSSPCLEDDIDEAKDPPSPPPTSTPFIPDKYMPWADSVFSTTAVDALPPHRPYDIAIELEEGKDPPFGPMYRLTQDEMKALSTYIEDNLKKGFIRRSTSSAAAPILFVRKKTGDLRLCVDYRGLNAITKKTVIPYHISMIFLTVRKAANSFLLLILKMLLTLFASVKATNGKLPFVRLSAFSEYLVMPMGLTNAPSVFQAFIQDTLRDFLGIFCVVYLDDILIFSRTQEEHDAQVKLVLDRLKGARLFANPKKCEFDKSEVEYLGYLIGADGIKMNPKKLATIAEWPVPRSSHDVQVFLGFCNFYRRFVDHYASLALPLHRLTRKDVPFVWSDSERSSFESLKRAFTSYPVLRHYDPSLPATLSTDASDFALSGILQQPDDNGHLHPVAFYSRKFSPAEINYDIHDKELLAIVDSFRDMRAWLMGTAQPIAVICDHKNLEYFMTSHVLNRRQARWSMFLSEFDFQLDWSPGTKNPADAPSRQQGPVDPIPSSSPLSRALCT